MRQLRTLDSLILSVAGQLDAVSAAAPGSDGASADAFADASTVVVCDDPTGDLIAAALASGTAVLSIDADYSRARAAHDAGAKVAGIDGPLRADEFLFAVLGSKKKRSDESKVANGGESRPASNAERGGIVAVGEMPKSLGRLDYIARALSGVGCPRVVLGANNKHLSRSMNDVLGDSFTNVAASRGKGKFRCLMAAGPRDVTYEPVRADGFTAYGGVFAGAREDYGGKLLADTLLSAVSTTRACSRGSAEAGGSTEAGGLGEVGDPDKVGSKTGVGGLTRVGGSAGGVGNGLGRVLDLGCGNGSVAKRLLDAGAQVTATDSDADAVLSTTALGIETTWDDAGSRFPDASFDTITLNPPFHDRAGIDATLVQHLLDASARLLAPGGQLFLVHNSHLRYRGEVERRFSVVEQAARNAKFTVLRAVS